MRESARVIINPPKLKVTKKKTKKGVKNNAN